MHIGSLKWEYKVEETKTFTPADVYGSVDVSRYLGPDEEFTGEFRPPVVGDSCLFADWGLEVKHNLTTNFKPHEPRLIVRKKPLAFNQKWRIADGEQPRYLNPHEYKIDESENEGVTRDDENGGLYGIVVEPIPGFTPVAGKDYKQYGSCC